MAWDQKPRDHVEETDLRSDLDCVQDPEPLRSEEFRGAAEYDRVQKACDLAISGREVQERGPAEEGPEKVPTGEEETVMFVLFG